MRAPEDDEVVSVHAGFPNPAADMSLQGLDLHKLLVRHAASTYYFRVRGRTWETIGIFDGDIAIVDRALQPRRTDIVVWWQEGGDAFQFSAFHHVPKESVTWGVVTTTIHQLREENHG